MYIVYGADNESYAFRDSPELTESQRLHQSILPDFSSACHDEVRRCPDCGELLNKFASSLSGIKFKKRLDLSTTYDGITVVSKYFLKVYIENHLEGLVFRELPNAPNFYSACCSRIVVFDAKRRGTRFIDRCAVCGICESVVGANPVFLADDTKIASKEFVRTDLEFGSNDEKGPLLLCGELTAEVLRSFSLRGLEIVEQID